jgi:hypothetical protein
MKESSTSVTRRKPSRSREERWVESSDAFEPAGTAAETSQPNLEERIAVLAYYKAERRGFVGDHELEDWLEAEKELNSAK